jgi:hypothetical protein
MLFQDINQDNKKYPLKGTFSFVAGPGIEPGSGGYEPPEVPLLYPAIYVYTFTNI